MRVQETAKAAGMPNKRPIPVDPAVTMRLFNAKERKGVVFVS
jgi:hypothetical protein